MSFKYSISEKQIFDYHVDDLFHFTQDITNRKKWDKQTKKIEFMEGSTKLEKGARVFVESTEGVPMETTYLVFNPPHAISIRMTNTSFLFNGFVGSWFYTAKSLKATELMITYEYNLRFPFNVCSRLVAKKIRKNMKMKLQYLISHLNSKPFAII